MLALDILVLASTPVVGNLAFGTDALGLLVVQGLGVVALRRLRLAYTLVILGVSARG
jgi:hypothetical protein